MIGHSWLDIDNSFHTNWTRLLQVNSSCAAGVIFPIQIHGNLKSDWLHACSNQWNAAPYTNFTLQIQLALQLETKKLAIAIRPCIFHILRYGREEPSAKKRGPYRRYLTDLTCPVTRTRWRNQRYMICVHVVDPARYIHIASIHINNRYQPWLLGFYVIL